MKRRDRRLSAVKLRRRRTSVSERTRRPALHGTLPVERPVPKFRVTNSSARRLAPVGERGEAPDVSPYNDSPPEVMPSVSGTVYNRQTRKGRPHKRNVFILRTFWKLTSFYVQQHTTIFTSAPF